MKQVAPQSDPVLARLFSREGLTPETFDAAVIEDSSARLKIVYFWGEDCPNCGIAKAQMKAIAEKLVSLPVDFHSVDAYTHMDLATRFGLFGIPVFLFFKSGRLLGRITSFPTRDLFIETIERHV